MLAALDSSRRSINYGTRSCKDGSSVVRSRSTDCNISKQCTICKIDKVNWCLHTLSDVNVLLQYMSRMLYIRSKCNLAITITAVLYKYIRQSPSLEIKPTAIGTLNFFYDSASFLVLVYIVHCGNRLPQSRLHIRISGTSLTLLSFNNI